ncbi:hypothetical protein [Myxococcus sp. RHSTA-1-4]|uniref:hypothetical protein n=1 Tax=Myxococcus sp. RHSTA-1-4 TaxID=2874601 RepID=UPI001CBE6094|nr:hypothetical protein [Myxococcus sp. RHSTA-1-4]MBZ4421320.1 hypothetical protein [Myxococcus sp. RHSTA-1-4]
MRKLVALVLWCVWLGCRADLSEGDSRDAGPGSGPGFEAACAPAEKPTCCAGCEDILIQPVCTAGSWSCPAGSTDERQCPNTPERPACSLPRHPQETYTYPGCANDGYGCPRLLTVYCALEKLRTERAHCEQDSDCVAANVDGRCAGYGQCPPAMVSRTAREDFEAKAAEELSRYCTGSPICVSSGSCGFPSFESRCKQGQCVAEPPDAGP